MWCVGDRAGRERRGREGHFAGASPALMENLLPDASAAPSVSALSVPSRRLGLLQAPLPPVSMALLLLVLLASSASIARGVEPGDCGDGLDCSVYEDLGVHVDMGGASERVGPPDNSWSDMDNAGQVMEDIVVVVAHKAVPAAKSSLCHRRNNAAGSLLSRQTSCILQVSRPLSPWPTSQVAVP